MEEAEKRAKTEKFLNGLINEWERLINCQSTGVGIYCSKEVVKGIEKTHDFLALLEVRETPTSYNKKKM